MSFIETQNLRGERESSFFYFYGFSMSRRPASTGMTMRKVNAYFEIETLDNLSENLYNHHALKKVVLRCI